MKVIDCFPFFNELDVLEVRLNELKDVVDVFVLTESPKTFTGMRKHSYFKKHKERFKKFNIVHTVYNDKEELRPAERERRQKQYNLDYVFDNIFEPGDIIIQGDCDEIPRVSVVEKLIQEDWQSVGLVLKLFYYYMNCGEIVQEKRVWRNTRLIRPTERIVYNARRRDAVDKFVWDAGWHFSYSGDIKYKLKAWGHSIEYDRPPYNTPEHIRKCKEEGLDLIMRRGNRKIDFEFIKDLDYLPKYVLKNMDKFKKYIRR